MKLKSDYYFLRGCFALEEVLQKILEKSSRRIISSLVLEQKVQAGLKATGRDVWSYGSFARAMAKLVERGLLAPVKAPGYNGRRPPLAVRYRRAVKPLHRPPEIFQFRSQMDLSYFARKHEEFYRYQDILQAMDRYLVEVAREKPLVWDTLNERSFQLAGDEKFLASPAGAALLSRIRISHEDLHCHPVSEPFFYRLLDSGVGRKEPVSVLVVENKDSFHTLYCLLEEGFLVLYPPIDLVVYGEGNKICGSWPFFYGIPGLVDKQIRVYYYGDLDPMGLIIFYRWQKIIQRRVAERGDWHDLAASLQILPAQGLYRCLLQQGRGRESNVEGSIPADYEVPLWAQFAPVLRRSIKELWAGGRMIPQEALSASRLTALKEIVL